MRTNETAFVVSIAALWVAITALGSTGHWFAGLLLSIVLIAMHALLGAAHKGRVSPRIVIALVAPWALSWLAAFLLAQRDALAFEGAPPAFTILGMHPSFAWIVILYWFVPSILVCIAFTALRDEWLSASSWEEFRSRMARPQEPARDE
jgi:hypothetical protein